MRRNSLSLLQKRRRSALLSLFTLATAGALACDDPFALEASLETVRDTLTVYAMTGTSPAYPSALDARTGFVVRIEPNIAFDVAFDLNPDGSVRVIPARLISPTKIDFGQTTLTHGVALQVPAGGFESITIAPSNGYKADSLVTVDAGETVVARVESSACFLSPVIYAKFVVDSVNAVTRQIFLRTVRNPNCGFRSFQPGVPKD